MMKTWIFSVFHYFLAFNISSGVSGLASGKQSDLKELGKHGHISEKQERGSRTTAATQSHDQDTNTWTLELQKMFCLHFPSCQGFSRCQISIKGWRGSWQCPERRHHHDGGSSDEKGKKTYQGSNGGQAKEGSKTQRTRSQTAFYQGSKAWLQMRWRAAGRGALISVTILPSMWQRFLLTRGVNHKGPKGRGVRNDTGRPFIDNGWRELLSLEEKGVAVSKKKNRKPKRAVYQKALDISDIGKLQPGGHMQHAMQHVKQATLEEILIVGKSKNAAFHILFQWVKSHLFKGQNTRGTKWERLF